MKVCSNCGIQKEITDFHKDKKGKYGVRKVCKSCTHKIYVARQIKVKNSTNFINSFAKSEQKHVEAYESLVMNSLEKEDDYPYVLAVAIALTLMVALSVYVWIDGATK